VATEGGGVTVDLAIRDQASSGRESWDWVLEGIDPRITLRDLIRTRVREEVARFNADHARVFRGLVQPAGSALATDGYVVRPGRTIDWEQQADAAEAAFLANGFFVIVGERQVTDLDAALDLDAGTLVRFVRLVPLVGG
jgi:hypothetical protein